jgi:hypothetical protein
VENALRAGLFLAEFGPAYYRGYVDRQETAAVPLAPAPTLLEATRGGTPLPIPAPRRSWLRPALFGAAAALLASSAIFAGMAWNARDENQRAIERDSPEVVSRFRVETALSAGALVVSAACTAIAFFASSER